MIDWTIYQCTSQMRKLERDLKSLVKKVSLLLLVIVVSLGSEVLFIALSVYFSGSKLYLSAKDIDNFMNLTITFLLVQFVRLFIESAHVKITFIQLRRVYHCQLEASNKELYPLYQSFCPKNVSDIVSVIFQFIDLRSCSLFQYVFIAYQVLCTKMQKLSQAR